MKRALRSVVGVSRSITGPFAKLPTLGRLITVTVWTVLALGVSFILNPTANQKLAVGAAAAIAVLGLSLLTGHSGQISIGNSGFIMIGGYGAAIWAFHHAPPLHGAGTWVWISLIFALAAGAVIGLLVGLPGTRLRGPYLAGFTLAFATVLTPFLINLGSVTGASQGLFVPYLKAPTWFVGFFSGPYAQQNADAQFLADYIIVAAGISFFFMANLFRSRTGRAMRMVRDNDVAAELLGVPLARTRAVAFVISAAYGGLAGGLLVLVQQGINPNSYQLATAITLLTAMVIGGIGTLNGAVLAGIFYAFSGTIVSSVNSWTGINPTSNLGVSMNGILFGALLIVMMLAAPRGVVGLLTRVKGWALQHLEK